MALFGEKYGDVVRMVEVGDGSFSRELCGGTHVRRTAEIGLFRMVSETSSASNVRRIEALTGPEAVNLVRRHDAALVSAAQELRVTPEAVPETVVELRARVRELERSGPARKAGAGAVDVDELAASSVEVSGAQMLVAAVQVDDAKELLDAVDRLKNKLENAAIVLVSAGSDRVDLIASVAPSLVTRGLKAGDLVKAAAAVVGGGGGGRDTLARAGGRDVTRVPEALQAAREAIETALATKR
jgi:alanyl-tRNA synthetase